MQMPLGTENHWHECQLVCHSEAQWPRSMSWVDSQLHPLPPTQGTLDKSPHLLGSLEMSLLLSLLEGILWGCEGEGMRCRMT